MKRYGQIIGIKPDQIEAYERLVANVWPELLETFHKYNMRNYSVFRYQNLLFTYFEYVGDDFASDMAHVAVHPKVREWVSLTDPMQDPMPDRVEGEWWTNMRELFHSD